MMLQSVRQKLKYLLSLLKLAQSYFGVQTGLGNIPANIGRIEPPGPRLPQAPEICVGNFVGTK